MRTVNNRRCPTWYETPDPWLNHSYGLGDPVRCKKIAGHRGRCCFTTPRTEVFKRTPGFTDDGDEIAEQVRPRRAPFAHWAWRI